MSKIHECDLCGAQFPSSDSLKMMRLPETMMRLPETMLPPLLEHVDSGTLRDVDTCETCRDVMRGVLEAVFLNRRAERAARTEPEAEPA